MNIEIFDEDICKEFSGGEIVFRIVAEAGKCRRDIGMVTTNKDFEKKLTTHLYNPVIFCAPLWVKLAYLYGCLNYEYHTPREETFIFFWRKIGTNNWKKWFKVLPYHDSVY